MLGKSLFIVVTDLDVPPTEPQRKIDCTIEPRDRYRMAPCVSKL